MPPSDCLPPEVFVPLLVILAAALAYQYGHALMVWLGFKEDR